MAQQLQRWRRGDAQRRAAEGWRLRATGHTWPEIAEIVGYSDASTANRAVMRWHGSLPPIDLKGEREKAKAAGEALLREAWQDVLDRRPGAVTAMVRVLHRQASLMGLDAPSRLDVRSGPLDSFTEWYASQPEPVADVVDAEVVH